MVTRQNTASLSEEQQSIVVALVREQIGNEADSRQFSEAATLLLENIAGFETISQKHLSNLIAKLWRQYRECR